MWVFLTSRLRMWFILAVAVPLFVGTLGVVRRQIETRRGPNTFTRAISKAEEFIGGARRNRAM